MQVLGGLAPLGQPPVGALLLPGGGGTVAVVPQVPLVPTEQISLAEYLCYPDCPAPGAGGSGGRQQLTAEKDAELRGLLRAVSCEYVVDREGWDAVRSWDELLSTGEQQCFGLARLLRTSPDFALLDEAVTGIAPAVVAAAYRELRARGTTVVTFTREFADTTLAELHGRQLHLGALMRHPAHFAVCAAVRSRSGAVQASRQRQVGSL